MDIVCRCGCRESAFQCTAIFWQTDRERFADNASSKNASSEVHDSLLGKLGAQEMRANADLALPELKLYS